MKFNADGSYHAEDDGQGFYRDALRGNARIRAEIWRHGEESACGHYGVKPKPPYKRKDYCDIWQQAFDTAEANIAAALAELNAFYHKHGCLYASAPRSPETGGG